MKFVLQTASILLLALLCSTAPLAALPPAQKFTVKIDAQPMEQALNSFAAQAGLQLLVRADTISKDTMAPQLVGTYTAEDALKRLLANTSLNFKFIDERTVAIRSAVRGQGEDEGAGLASPAGQMRLTELKPGTDGERTRASTAGETKDQVTVRDRRVTPFINGNADLPRTVDDAQAYYIFDSQEIERAGSVNLEDFLKQRLTMNAVAQTNAQNPRSSFGTTSTIDLRGLGSDKTLILVNGRRMANISFQSQEFQPDINGIALASIDRIEVLPSSASGIYGGSAIGGVVNIILKRDYSGGDVRANYENTSSGDSAGRKVSASYGFALEEGRTHMNLTAAWSDKESLVLLDRADIFQNNLNTIAANNPTQLSSSYSPWLGSAPNIVSGNFRDSEAPLALKTEYGGTVLGSRITRVPVGTAAGSTAALAQLVRDNAGQWNLDFPQTTQSPTGLLRPFNGTPQTKSVQAGVRREMLPWLELMADLSWNRNESKSTYNPLNSSLTVPAAAAISPFAGDVFVMVPDATQIPMSTVSVNRSATLGAVARLPYGWTGALDYTWAESEFNSLSPAVDTPAQDADIMDGDLNPFVDTLLYPLNMQKYLYWQAYEGVNRMQALALRGSGPLPALPWGQPTLTLGLERRIAHTPEQTNDQAFPISTEYSSLVTTYARDSITDSGYLEATVPLVKPGRFPGVHSLDLQVAGRTERFEVDTGTPDRRVAYGQNPPQVSYSTPNIDGTTPVFSRASYSSTNYTLGLKYQPAPEVTLRVSQATAFLPPRPEYLQKNPKSIFEMFGIMFDQVIDRPSGATTPMLVDTIGGGNPGLKPQNSKSFNAGLIWEPTGQRLKGLRLNTEYYRIEQFDAIGTLGAQAIVDQFPERVTRNGAGRITRVDVSMINLYHRETEGWDLNLDYALDTRAGRFNLHAAESIILHLKEQYSQTQPEYDAVNFPSESGAIKYKNNLTLNWERGPLALGWTVRYFGSYKQMGAAGGPEAARAAGYGEQPPTYYTSTQGSDAIPSQTYHDLFVGYSFDRAPGTATGRLLDGVSLQLGVRNVFDKAPPMDVFYSSGYYLSPFGDINLRSYWLSARMGF